MIAMTKISQDPSAGGDQIGNHTYTGTTILGSASAASKSESGSKQTKKGKQNRGSGKMYDNRESVDSVMFSKENNFKTTLHPRPPSASRPRSRLGAWGRFMQTGWRHIISKDQRFTCGR